MHYAARPRAVQQGPDIYIRMRDIPSSSFLKVRAGGVHDFSFNKRDGDHLLAIPPGVLLIGNALFIHPGGAVHDCITGSHDRLNFRHAHARLDFREIRLVHGRTATRFRTRFATGREDRGHDGQEQK